MRVVGGTGSACGGRWLACLPVVYVCVCGFSVRAVRARCVYVELAVKHFMWGGTQDRRTEDGRRASRRGLRGGRR